MTKNERAIRAVSGSCKFNPGINGSNPYVIMTVTQQKQDIVTNKTTIAYELTLYRPSIVASDTPKPFSITIDGVKVKSGTTIIGGSGTKSIAAGTTEVTHENDGKKTVTFGFSLDFKIDWGNKRIETGTASGSLPLTVIPRATVPSLNPAKVDMGETTTINLPRASSSFTHTLMYNFYEDTWKTFAEGATTSATLTVPLDWANRIPDNTSGGGRIKCTTYNGNKIVGETIVNFTAKVPAAVLPTISDVSITEAVAGIAEKFGAYVQNKSKATVNITAAGAYRSTITKYSTVIDTQTYIGQAFTSELIPTGGAVPVTVTVTDTRGRTATKKIYLDVLAYNAPVVNDLFVERGNAAGVADQSGAYALITLDFDISLLNNLNVGQYTLEYKTHKAADWTTLGTWQAYSRKETINAGAILDADNPYMVRLTLTDFFGTLPVTFDAIPPGFTLVDYKANGLGIAFGTVANEDGATMALPFTVEEQGLDDDTPIALKNGWTSYGSGFGTATYWKDPFGVVHLSGVVTGGTTAKGTVIGLLPEGFRPRKNEAFAVINSELLARIDVRTTGEILNPYRPLEPGGWVSLSGISFRT